VQLRKVEHPNGKSFYWACNGPDCPYVRGWPRLNSKTAFGRVPFGRVANPLGFGFSKGAAGGIGYLA
jgi:hypothetical protein